MEKAQIEKAWKMVKFHTKIALRGFYRTLYGTAVAGLVAMSVCGFVSVTTETGWVAVCGFIASCAILVVALSNMYFMGGCKKGAKHG